MIFIDLHNPSPGSLSDFPSYQSSPCSLLSGQMSSCFRAFALAVASAVYSFCYITPWHSSSRQPQQVLFKHHHLKAYPIEKSILVTISLQLYLCPSIYHYLTSHHFLLCFCEYPQSVSSIRVKILCCSLLYPEAQNSACHVIGAQHVFLERMNE